MENAAKALLISAGVLIAILLLSLFAYLFTQMSGETDKIYDIMNATEISEFNQKFLNYDGRGTNFIIISRNIDGTPKETEPDYLNKQEILTIVNLAIDSNKKGKVPQFVEVIFKGSTHLETLGDTNEILKNSTYEGNFKCRVTVNPETKLVSKVEIYL